MSASTPPRATTSNAAQVVLGGLLAGLLTLATVTLPGCAVPQPTSPPVTPPDRVAGTPTTTPLPSVEVTSYKGKKLDQIDTSLRENSIKGPQEIDHASYRLRITGLVDRPLTLTYADVIGRPNFRKAVTLDCVEGWSSTLLWQGVLVRDLLKEAGVRPQARVVIFKAHDGYTDAFPVSYFSQRDILMAYLQNGRPLTAKWGWPFQLVAEDKWGYKWVKWIEEIQLSADTTYRGYWEQRGYSNDGGLNKPFVGP